MINMIKTLISIVILTLIIAHWKTISPIAFVAFKHVDQLMFSIHDIFEKTGKAAEEVKETGQKIKKLLDELPSDSEEESKQ